MSIKKGNSDNNRDNATFEALANPPSSFSLTTACQKALAMNFPFNKMPPFQRKSKLVILLPDEKFGFARSYRNAGAIIIAYSIIYHPAAGKIMQCFQQIITKQFEMILL